MPSAYLLKNTEAGELWKPSYYNKYVQLYVSTLERLQHYGLPSLCVVSDGTPRNTGEVCTQQWVKRTNPTHPIDDQVPRTMNYL